MVLIFLFALVDHYMVFPEYNIGSVGFTLLLTLEFAVMHSQKPMSVRKATGAET